MERARKKFNELGDSVVQGCTSEPLTSTINVRFELLNSWMVKIKHSTKQFGSLIAKINGPDVHSTIPCRTDLPGFLSHEILIVNRMTLQGVCL